MTTSLALRSPALLAEPEELFPSVGSGPLAELLEKHGADRERIERLAAIVAGDGYQGVICHFLDGNIDGDGRSSARSSQGLLTPWKPARDR